MSEDRSAGSPAKGPFPSVRDFEFAGKAYVIMAKDEFERLCQSGQGSSPPTFTCESVRKDLRAWRRREGLTLAEVSRRAGIALETLSRIETGRTNPSVATLSSILRALDQGGQA